MHRRVVAIGVLLFATSIALAGCGGGAAADDSSPTGSPTSSPTPEPATLPQPTLPVSCADVLTDSQASDILQAPVTLKVNETTIQNDRSIASLQSGLLSCVWGGDNKTDNSWDQSIDLRILPNAKSDYQTGVMDVDDGAIVYTVGDLSEYLCPTTQIGAGYSFCAANLLQNGYWAQVRATSFGTAAGRTQDTANASMASLLDSLSATIAKATPPRPTWTAPGGALSGGYCTDKTPSAPIPVPTAQSVALDRAGLVYCTFDDPQLGSSASVTVIPGGAWAFPGMLASPPKTSWSLPVMAPVAIAGTDAALIACGEEGSCQIFASMGGSAVTIYGDNIGQDAFVAAATPLVAAIAAAG